MYVSQMFICSSLAFEVFLDEVLGLRLLAIVLNDCTAAASPLTGLPLSLFYRGLPSFPVFLVIILRESDLVNSSHRAPPV